MPNFRILYIITENFIRYSSFSKTNYYILDHYFTVIWKQNNTFIIYNSNIVESDDVGKNIVKIWYTILSYLTIITRLLHAWFFVTIFQQTGVDFQTSKTVFFSGMAKRRLFETFKNVVKVLLYYYSAEIAPIAPFGRYYPILKDELNIPWSALLFI